MLSQPRMQSLDNPAAYHVGLALLGVGGVFVLSSFLALGFTGTFLGKTLSAGSRALLPPTPGLSLPCSALGGRLSSPSQLLGLQDGLGFCCYVQV